MAGKGEKDGSMGAREWARSAAKVNHQAYNAAGGDNGELYEDYARIITDQANHEYAEEQEKKK